MGNRRGTIGKWWPTTQSLDLVDAPVERAAAAVEAEVRRFLKDTTVTSGWRAVHDLDSAFSLPPVFTNVPTYFLVLPTRSRWTVLWNNSFLCDGYDSLCWCLSKNHGLTTMHWFAHDDWTTMQAGAGFTYRRCVGTDLVERSVYCAQEDTRWHFHAIGTPLPEEAMEQYAARRKRDRLNEASMAVLLRRLEADPWVDEFYALPDKEIFVVQRLDVPSTVAVRGHDQVLRGGPTRGCS